ncbi:hypothetical protein [Halosegnis longus]|uniref:Uncharacterized protein n=1 Tax=Halosegnis longus TaxID=2216012 RepID=A0AAJ4R6J1_9EURY|nr:hypothetical protein Nmn1133_01375 [Salella cibi]
MSGTEQFSQTVRGSGGVLATAATGTVQTDNYATGGHLSASGAADYPLSLNPAATIQELNVTRSNAALVITVTTTGGDEFQTFANGTIGSRDKWEIDHLEVTDPTGSGAKFDATWAGE